MLDLIENVRSRRPKFRDAQITMAHGAGGKATQSLVEGLFLPILGGEALSALGDAGEVAVDGVQLAITTDSYVVKPLRFPGGSIGELAVNGTVNDLAVSGARAIGLSLSLVLEEGLAADELRAQVEAIAAAAQAAGVEVVAGDTKVVERGHADGMYVCTTGVGRRDPRATLSPAAVRPATGCCCPARSASTGWPSCWPAASSSWTPRSSRTRARCGRRWTPCWRRRAPDLHCMRDATRGGVASVLNELARSSAVAMLVRESAVPVLPAVAGAAEILGIDPMHVANEGKLVAFVAPARGRPGAGRAARGARLRAGGGDRRGADGASRDGADGDQLRRAQGDRPAGRRPVAEDLLGGADA